MSLQLPNPAPPGASRAHARAHKLWQAGQSHARREQWPLAAQSFEQAAALHGDAAYALAATHALIKAGRAADAVGRARAIRAADPRAGIAYTLESHALLGLGRAEESVECLRTLPADVGRDLDHHVSLAVSLQRSRRHEEAIRSFFDALALKMDDALSHFRLGMSFKELGMKAEAAECVRTAVVLGLGSSDLAARAQLVFLEREACRWAAADEAMAGLRAPSAPCRPTRRSRPARSRTPCSSTIRSSSSRWRGTTRSTSPSCTGRCRGASPGRTAGGCASATSRPTSTSARDQPADGADARMPRPRRASR